jgi:hypothetical protein
VTPFLTTDDDEGVMRFRAWAIPVLIAVICASIVASMALAGLVGAGLGMAVGAVAATGLVVFASRSKPDRKLEVAAAGDDGHRVLVVATAEATAESAQRIAELAGKTIDVRLVVPVPSHRLDRWMSAEDDARRDAEGLLARSAGALVAAGLPVSGSVGDHDPAQALEDELRDFPADEVVLLIANGKDPLAKIETRLSLPLRRVSP